MLGRRLADGLATTVVWSSPERKARQTAALAYPSVAIHVREELSEVKRPWYADPEELADGVAGYLRGEVVVGWEHRDDVLARLAQLQRLASLDAGFISRDRVALVTHGVLLTAWLHHKTGLDDPFSFWSGLRMPDAWELDIEKRSLQRIP